MPARSGRGRGGDKFNNGVYAPSAALQLDKFGVKLSKLSRKQAVDVPVEGPFTQDHYGDWAWRLPN